MRDTPLGTPAVGGGSEDTEGASLRAAPAPHHREADVLPHPTTARATPWRDGRRSSETREQEHRRAGRGAHEFPRVNDRVGRAKGRALDPVRAAGMQPAQELQAALATDDDGALSWIRGRPQFAATVGTDESLRSHAGSFWE